MAIFKKSPRPRMPHETSWLRRLVITFSVLLGAAAILAGFWFLSQLGPKSVDYISISEQAVIPDEVKALQQESVQLEAQLEEILSMRDANEQDVALLKQALDLQEEYLSKISRADSDATRRRDELNKRYQDLAAEGMRQRSMLLETEAEKLARNQEYEAAREKYLAALEAQNEINENFPLSSSYNIGRSSRLDRQAQFLVAEPLYRSSVEMEAEADELILKEDWDTAELRLKEAISIQDQLNREYRGTNQASVSRLEELRVKLVGIRSGQSYVEVQRLSDLADQSQAKVENLQAASLYQEAARQQRILNDKYPDSPYASSERVAEYQRKSQTAQSFELGLEIERNDDRLTRLLSERRTFEAVEVIAALRRDIQQMEEVFPRSSLNDEELQVKIRYLNLVQNDLGFIQDRIYSALLPIPEVDGWKMLRTEVPQALYSLIMGINPSRNSGDLNPVDSVSWTEAKSFCDRLAWIMGKPVRLPSENEFRLALGRLRYVVLEDHVWSAANTRGLAEPVATKEPFASGFHDLLGNVSEWLESMDRFEDEDARHIGGHAQDRLEAIFTVPVRDAPRAERNRMTGFRVVIAVD